MRLRLESPVTGRLHAQFIIRIFGAPQFREIIQSSHIDLDHKKEANVDINFPQSTDKIARRAIETWLSWEGTDDFRLRDLPSIC
ncbi:hypothetical protein JQ597_12920 [Bradyrhizobium sp. AUGA SZCCT0177]|uniref:hypothetical protein n=1 Tax=unclassified Bradyrhizobium TaxID=2631580 RepID=UPI001BAB114B|nr:MULTISPECIES: hypothetical protein [unclassified Bradyrhizobium]MBR1233671.1 hypothetical protein [Bradyrhizobium sp. AUGA SZCCT0182]MBR1282943.1 hypothetical protein [Bradyrhizobium sp. AUGA SZCCT0177]